MAAKKKKSAKARAASRARANALKAERSAEHVSCNYDIRVRDGNESFHSVLTTNSLGQHAINKIRDALIDGREVKITRDCSVSFTAKYGRGTKTDQSHKFKSLYGTKSRRKCKTCR